MSKKEKELAKNLKPDSLQLKRKQALKKAKNYKKLPLDFSKRLKLK